MALRLFIVHGSHPCNTVMKALELKGLSYKVVELPPPMHAAVTKVVFGERTVPALIIDGGEKVRGSRAILRRLDVLAPDPPLLPADPATRDAVLEAERWGDETFQPVARRLLWTTFARRPETMAGYQDGGRLPALPLPVLKALAPVITRVEKRLNAVTPETVQRDLEQLPAHLDLIDAWLANGTLGTRPPNAADLQIAATLRLLLTIGDVRPVVEGRPAADLALRLFPHVAGTTPAGVLSPA
ncbi:MAG: glutathione S-transferase N-terminal domain-containing protein [Actinomycetota bacterium]|nr:glutathione S-transferase N-terminal domain-containing protein [Actinomycetota bacterium]MDQ3408775.1 glutathione S-transferase N-terminal domain-containing protein [Actinomycetota bacterium]